MGLRAELRLGEGRVVRLVAYVDTAVEQVAFVVGIARDELALIPEGTGHQQVDAGAGRGLIGVGQGDLLADNRGEVRLEDHHIGIKRLVDGDTSWEHREAFRVVNLDAQERREGGERLIGVRQAPPEVRGKAEGEGGVEAAIVGEAKASDLVTTELPGPRRWQKERREREAELADLLVQIPQVRGLDVDRSPDLRGEGVGAKEPRLGGHTGVGRGIERMTVATGKQSGP